MKEGLSILDVQPFFVEFRLQLRVFDQFYKLFHKCGPPTRNHHDKAMYCLMAGGRVYTLNHDDRRLKQGLQLAESDEEESPEFKLKVGETI